jgi:uncharacterized membrane protein YphA (DoxX/SURF4 family)
VSEPEAAADAVAAVPDPGSPSHEPGRWGRVQPWVSLVVRVGLAFVFFWSGIAKISDLDQARRAVAAYQLFPYTITQIIGVGLPIVELAVAVLLLAGLVTRYTAIVYILIMAAFIFGIAHSWASGLNIDCGCFGGGGAITGSAKAEYIEEILRDVGLALCAAYLAWWPRTPFSADKALRLFPERTPLP